MNVLARLVAAIGVIVMWAYARACRDRNITRRRLARANLLRAVTTRLPHHKDGGCDRTVIVDITPDTMGLEQILDELPFKDGLTPWQREVVRRAFDRQQHQDTLRSDAGGVLDEWWREDSTDRYPGRGGW